MSFESDLPPLDAPAGDGDAMAGDGDAKNSPGGNHPLSALMETEPNLNPREESENLGIGIAGGHIYVGFRKVLNNLTNVGGPASGTPAIVNFGMGGMAFLRARQETGEKESGRVSEGRE